MVVLLVLKMLKLNVDCLIKRVISFYYILSMISFKVNMYERCTDPQCKGFFMGVSL